VKERWAIPPHVYGWEERNKSLRIGERTWTFPIFILNQDDINRIRHGYVCIVCLQCHEQPYPEHCAHDGCLFPIRAHQDEVFAQMYVGEMEVGPSTSLQEEFEIAKEEVARQHYEKGSSIWIPESARLH
jgi:hypothetical protein